MFDFAQYRTKKGMAMGLNTFADKLCSEGMYFELPESVKSIFHEIDYSNRVVIFKQYGLVGLCSQIFAWISLWYLVTWTAVHERKKPVKVINVFPSHYLQKEFSREFYSLLKKTPFKQYFRHRANCYNLFDGQNDLSVQYIVAGNAESVMGYRSYNLAFLTYDSSNDVIDVINTSLIGKHNKLVRIISVDF